MVQLLLRKPPQSVAARNSWLSYVPLRLNRILLVFGSVVLVTIVLVPPPPTPLSSTTTTATATGSSSSSSSSSGVSLSTSKSSKSVKSTSLRQLYETDDSGIHVGIVSKQPASFFDALRKQLDHDVDWHARCARYGGHYNATQTTPTKRRLFLGANIATEPWEVLEVVGAEGYGLYAGIVYVESNRTQNFTPRRVRRLEHGPIIGQIFGVPTASVQVRLHVHEDEWTRDLVRENIQRLDIMLGWRELGMTRNDVGIIADVDETFSRDFLLAMQHCDGIDALDYEMHHCHYNHVRITAAAQVFESSPECITANRHWNRPNAIIGHCIEGIADDELHPPAPRMAGRHRQAHGYGGDCDFSAVDNITDFRYPSWQPADFRDGCGPQTFVQEPWRSTNTTAQIAFHLHNFFAEFNTTRFKYETYAHAIEDQGRRKIFDLHEDLTLMYHCVQSKPYGPEVQINFQHEPGGFSSMKPFQPIYFYDADYRQRRHEHVRQIALADDAMIDALLASEQSPQTPA
jgi:hypothetical protein